MPPPPRDLAQTTLGVLFIGGLLFASFWVLRPFLPAAIWAAMVVVATWPVMLGVQNRLGGRRGAAVAVMTLSLLLVMAVPLSLAVAAIADNAGRIAAWARWLAEFTVPPPPAWVAGLPVVGGGLQTFWEQVAANGIQQYAARLAPYAATGTRWFLAEAGNFGLLFVHFALIVVIAAILYASGESAAAWLKRFGTRLAGARGAEAVHLAGQAIRGVALGVVVTALAQSLLGGIGLAVAGVPMAAVLTSIMFLLCIAQIGPVLVLLPAVIWLFWSGEQGWGLFLAVWGVLVTSLDNVLRPYLIKKGADLPLLLIFAGVIGGLLTLGLVGIFVGPVVLAVTYTLLDSWIEAAAEPGSDAPAPGPRPAMAAPADPPAEAGPAAPGSPPGQAARD
jgi:predicted PurR-regulated permease PerM